MKNFRHIFVPIHSRNIYVSKGTSFKTFKRRVFDEFDANIKDEQSSLKGCFYVLEKMGLKFGVIWLPKGANPFDVIHECFHAVCWIRASSGDWLTDSSEESYAYLLQWFCKEVGL